MSPAPKRILVIDPAVRVPELDCFNKLGLRSPLPLTYHQPALQGFSSLLQESEEGIAGIIVLGSSSSVHDSLDWQTKLEAWLLPRFERGVPTLAICYGHQMLAHMFAGRVDYWHPDRSKRVGFRQVTLQSDRLGIRQTGDLYLTHREIVTDAPASFNVIGKSDELAIEALEHASLPIWSLQAHPEATPEFLKRENLPAPSPEQFQFGESVVNSFFALTSMKR